MQQEGSPNQDETPTTVNIPVQGTASNQVNTSCQVTNVTGNQTIVQGPQYNIGTMILSRDNSASSSSQSTQTEITENTEEGSSGMEGLQDVNEEVIPEETGQESMPFSLHQDLEEEANINIPSSDSSNTLVTSSEANSDSHPASSSSINITGSNNVVVLIQGSDNKLRLPKAYAAHLSSKRDGDEEEDGHDDKNEVAASSNLDDLDATDDGRPEGLTVHTKGISYDKIQLGESLLDITSQDTTPTPDSAPVYPFSTPPVAYSHVSTVYSPTHTTDSDLSGSDSTARLAAIDESEVPSPTSTDEWMTSPSVSDISTITSPENRSYSPTTPVQSDWMSGPSTPDSENPPDSPGEAETPWEIMVRGEQAREAYVRACRLGTKKVYRTRLMLVGQERVGKTSLLKSLVGKKHDEKEEITDGVDTTTSCKVPMTDCTLPWEVQHSDKKDRVRHVSRQYNRAVGSSMALELLEMNQSEEDVETEQDNSQKVETPNITPLSSLEMEEDEDNNQSSQFQLSQSPSKVIVPHEITEEALQRLNQESSLHGEDQQKSKVDRVLEFQFWDFAGQDIYYTTHQACTCHYIFT
ncbi:uncharacterized protein [Amphiura filiformis]|uniref:uncharacterized protein n=1 Tax=Amphiura filiformis TaxID=82378 RepID=UPI003B215A05